VTNLANKAATANAPDPFAPENLRLDQSFVESCGVRKLLTTVPVGKPNRQDFIRVHPSPDYRQMVGLIDLKEEREVYLVPQTLAHELVGEFLPYTLFTTINRQGVTKLWPVRVPDADGRAQEWHRSAAEAAQLGMSKWVRVTANMSLGAYEVRVSDSTADAAMAGADL
jgi:hypothetical protein